jgi:hypothetical protein
MSKPRLTPEIARQIAAFVRAGGFAEIAAQAAGVPPELWKLWEQLGRKPRGPRKYRILMQQIDEAAAHARLMAEMEVHKTKPDLWLTRGPGKEREGRPGWSGVVKPLIALTDARSVNLLQDPQSAALIQLLLAALAPFPDARKAAVRALNGMDEPRRPLPLPPPSEAIVEQNS